MPFEVESITSPREQPFEYAGIYAQAYALYRRGYRLVAYKPEEIEMNRSRLAYDARPEDEDGRDTRGT